MLVRSDYLTESVDSILDNAVYLTESETMNNPAICPVIENSRLGIYIAPFTSVSGLMETYDIDGDTALAWVAESNGVDPDAITVSINDYDIIAEPNIVNEFSHYVVNPISEDSAAYQLMEACLDGYFNTGDEGYLDYYVEDALFDEETDYSLLNESWGGKALRKAGEFIGSVGQSAGKHTSSNFITTGLGKLGQKFTNAGATVGSKAVGLGNKFDEKIATSLPYRAVARVGSIPLKHKKLTAVAGGIYAYKHRKQIKAAIASKIAALRDKTQQLQQQQAAAATPEQKGIIQRAIDKIKQMINALIAKLKGLRGGSSSAPAVQ